MTDKGSILRRTGRIGTVLLAVAAFGCGGPEKAIEDKLEANVLFYSNFEKGVDALWAEGNRTADFDGARTRHHLNEGVADGSLEFEKGASALSYVARTNFPFNETDWSGAVSFWMKVNVSALEADFPEPFHIGNLTWDDAVLFVDFTKPPRSLRFGCYPDKEGEITDATVEKHVIEIPDIGWSGEQWHHVVITWEHFNTGQANAAWRLYIDGVEKGAKTGKLMTMTWDPSEVKARFNHYRYTGHIDEIAFFGTSLTAEDVAYLYEPVRPLNSLLKKGP